MAVVASPLAVTTGDASFQTHATLRNGFHKKAQRR
jgi:hypothetical protein